MKAEETMSYIETIASKLNDANVAHVVVCSFKTKIETELEKLHKSDRDSLWRNGVTLDGAAIKLSNELRRPNKTGLHASFILRNALEALEWYKIKLHMSKELDADIKYISAFNDFAVNGDIDIIGEVHTNLSALVSKFSEIAVITLNYLNKDDN